MEVSGATLSCHFPFHLLSCHLPSLPRPTAFLFLAFEGRSSVTIPPSSRLPSSVFPPSTLTTDAVRLRGILLRPLGSGFQWAQVWVETEVEVAKLLGLRDALAVNGMYVPLTFYTSSH